VTNPPVERPDDLRDVFRLYDKEGRGYVSVAEMRHLLTSVGEKLTDEEAEQLLRMSGCVHNGMVQYDSESCLFTTAFLRHFQNFFTGCPLTWNT